MRSMKNTLLAVVLIAVLAAAVACDNGGGDAGAREAPSVPAGLVFSHVTAYSLVLTWNASSDNVGVEGYRVYRNNGLAATVNATRFQDSGLEPATSYAYSVAAFDAVGNSSAQSAAAAVTTAAGGDDPLLPRASLDDFIYQGSFRAPFGQYGQGKIACNPQGDNGKGSLFLVAGGTDAFAVGEIAIPALASVSGRDGLGALHTAGILQHPADLYARIPVKGATWPAGAVNRFDEGNFAAFGGLHYEGGRLYFNAYTYYDAEGIETVTTGFVQDPGRLASSPVSGMFRVQGAAPASGWLAAVPAAWRARLQGSHLMGHDNQITIVSRASAGPSLFAFDLADVAAAANGAAVAARGWLDYSLEHSIWGDDMANVSGNNKTWTLKTETGVGLIVPGTRTYALLGCAGGFNRNPANPWHGTPEPAFQPPVAGTIVYKRDDSMGYNNGGVAVWDAQDRHYMFAFYDLEEILAASKPYAPRPYAHGIFPAPFPRYGHYTVPGQMADAVCGGAYDPQRNLLYLTLPAAANESDPLYPGDPVIAVYRFKRSNQQADGPDGSR